MYIHLYFMVATRVVAVTAARTLSTGLWRVRRLLRRHRRLLEASRRSPVVRDIVTATHSSATINCCYQVFSILCLHFHIISSYLLIPVHCKQ